MARVLVSEQLAEKGLEKMRSAGHVVDSRLDLTPESLEEVIGDYDALVVRSATKVTASVLSKGRDLKVVGRAGVGLDNVDVEAATELGVMVVNAPESNIISAAEHAFALLLSEARNIPQAHAALVEGRWERSKWEGVEIYAKTLGIVGLGRIGALVAQRALAFGMRLVAYDPYTSQERARRMGVELVSLDELVQEADFITIHLPKTKETAGLFGAELLSRTKKGVRIVNAARGGIIDEEALSAAIESGQVAGAAIDVFASEPTTSSPLFSLSSVVVTPHLGASTEEAQDKAGDQIADQIVLALAGDFVPYAVNVAANGASETVRPFLSLAERLGRFFSGLGEGLPEGLEVEYQGELGTQDTKILTLSILKGLFANSSEEPVSYVNAPRLAAERGLVVRESSISSSPDRMNRITLGSSSHSLSGTLIGDDPAKERIVMVDEHFLELPPAAHMVVVRNDDRPGMIGLVGTRLGEAGVSIANMAVGQTLGSTTALMVLSLDQPCPQAVIDTLRGEPGILEVHQISES